MRRSKEYSGELEKLTRDDSDLTITIVLKEAVKKKTRLRVTGYYQGYYQVIILTKDGLSMFYYNIKRNTWSNRIKIQRY